ncbi:MAG: hypothetical protein NZ902_05225 [Acidilobaceae archaeon]|nr:hypothetical protein [Acidilobaceae archaeon]MCX8165968.1 hypothetical protein [Acidilobaceae archaeon]MDW7974611.1 hypothetical protein [Sulfolobales archaeon]
MSSQLDRLLELSFRRRRAIAALAILLSVASSLIGIAHYFVPLLVYEGWLMSGYLGISSYELTVAGSRVEIRPLGSISLISLVMMVLIVSSLLFSALAVFAYVSFREKLYMESVVVSAFSSALSMSLLFSIMRVITDEILPSLPQRGSVSTSGGVLTFEAAREFKSTLYLLYEGYGTYMILLSAVLFLLSALVLYSRWRLEGSEVEALDQ